MTIYSESPVDWAEIEAHQRTRCVVEDCDRRRTRVDMCGLHMRETVKGRRLTGKTCHISTCSARSDSRGYCRRHYKVWSDINTRCITEAGFWYRIPLGSAPDIDLTDELLAKYRAEMRKPRHLRWGLAYAED